MSPQCAASETPAFIASVPLRENVAGVASFRCATSSRGPPVSMKSKRPARRQKRPRAGGSASGGASPAAHESNPARIKVNSTTLSLRQQLKLVQGREQASTPRQQLARTRYRKQKPDADFYQSQGGARGPEADLPDGKYDAQQQPVLYIDGYNIIGAWPRLRKHRDRGDLEDARRHLIDDVAEFSYMRGWACVVVFDACGNGTLQKANMCARRTRFILTFPARASRMQKTRYPSRQQSTMSTLCTQDQTQPTVLSSGQSTSIANAASGRYGRRRMTRR